MLDNPSRPRNETQRHDDKLADQVHREIGTTHYFSIAAGQPGDAEN